MKAENSIYVATVDGHLHKVCPCKIEVVDSNAIIIMLYGRRITSNTVVFPGELCMSPAANTE